MWAMHDNVRDELRQIKKDIQAKDIVSISQNLQKAFSIILQLIQIEEQQQVEKVGERGQWSWTCLA